MSHASYMRGSRLISAQFCRDRGCAGCIRCRPEGPKPTPRPADWGGKIRAKAEACARAIITGEDAPNTFRVDLDAAIRHPLRQEAPHA